MSRVYNFSAGPSMLPEWVLQKAASEMVEYGQSGQSVMEMSHRSAEYQAIIDDCEARLRRVIVFAGRCFLTIYHDSDESVSQWACGCNQYGTMEQEGNQGIE